MAKEKELEEVGFLKQTDDGGYRVNWDEVEEAKFEVLPKAVYNVVISEIEYKLSQASGKPMWAMVLEVTDGEYAGRKLFNNMSFSDKALPYTKRTLAKIAPQVLTSAFDPEDSDILNVFQGMELRARTKIGKNEQGEQRSEIADLLPSENAFVEA